MNVLEFGLLAALIVALVVVGPKILVLMQVGMIEGRNTVLKADLRARQQQAELERQARLVQESADVSTARQREREDANHRRSEEINESLHRIALARNCTMAEQAEGIHRAVAAKMLALPPGDVDAAMNAVNAIQQALPQGAGAKVAPAPFPKGQTQ